MREEIPNHDELLDDPLEREQEVLDDEERADDSCQAEDWE